MANEFIARRGIIILENGAKITGSSTVVGDITSSGDVKAVNFRGSGQYLTDIAADSVQFDNVLNKPTLISSSLQFNTTTTPFTGSFTGSFVGDGSGLTGVAATLSTAGTTGTGTVDLKTQTLTVDGANGVTTTVSGQTITVSIPSGLVSSSEQINVRSTTGIETLATTGSNTFTGVQTISNTTNSTNYTEGALIVQGGVGITKDVNISGSLTVDGLLTAVSMSTQYVTSSQYTVGTSRIILNDDDLVRFAGLSIVDSGSTAATASILWDSLNNHFIYETDDIHNGNVDPHSALFIAGPETYEDIGNEIGLVEGRVPIATSDHNIDNRVESSSIRIDFPSRLTHVEAGLVVTGSISSSVGFSGDGSGLTGVVSTLAITGSDGASITTGTVNLKTQAVTFSAGEGVDISVSGQTVSIAGEDASVSNKGIASFNSTNFTVTTGDVTSNNITINGTNVTLGGTRNITLAQITTQGASTTDQLTLSGGAVISGVLYSASSATGIAGPVTNQVVASFPTGSHDSVHFDYVVKDGTNYRTGTVMGVWDGSGNVEYTDTSTNDIGDTLTVTFVVDTNAGNVRLKTSATTGTWTVKTATRML
jgi:hypothetical protein